MKKFLTILPLLCVSVPAFAEINPTDKVFFFYPDELAAQLAATFSPKDPYALRAAQKYADLMDSTGRVSLSDLREVCSIGKVDDNECKNFITNLAIRAGAFSWKDNTVYSNATSYGTYVDFDGNSNNSGKAAQIANSLPNKLKAGEWLVQFSWMEENGTGYSRRYPGYNYIRGTSACKQDQALKLYKNKADKDMSKAPGTSCWCKITEPVTTPWIFFEADMTYSGGTMWGGAQTESCDKGCAKLCQSRLRNNKEAKEKTFAVVSDRKDSQDLLYVSKAVDGINRSSEYTTGGISISNMEDNLNNGYLLQGEDGKRDAHYKMDTKKADALRNSN